MSATYPDGQQGTQNKYSRADHRHPLLPESTQSSPGLLAASDKVKLDNLKTVATSGSYSDLSNKPTIPPVLKAGTNVNIDSSNKINVPNVAKTNSTNTFSGDQTINGKVTATDFIKSPNSNLVGMSIINNYTLGTNWNGSAGRYFNSITYINLPSDQIFINPILSDTSATAKDQLTAWNKIGNIKYNTSNSTLAFYCYDSLPPVTEIPIKITAFG
jgi:hypothetical protein